MTRLEHIQQLIHYSKNKGLKFDYFGVFVSVSKVEITEECDTDKMAYTFWISNGEAFRIKITTEEARNL